MGDVDVDVVVDVAIIGAGTAGLYALREVRRAKKSFVLIDHGPLGTTCARVGCMPSKVALHTAEIWKESRRSGMAANPAEPIALQHARAWASLRTQRDRFARGAAGKATRAGGEYLLMGRARFLAPNLLEVDDGNQRTTVRAHAVVIATGSSPVVPEALAALGERVITTDQLFELETLPKSVAVMGLGAVGLEMGLALSRLGIAATGVGAQPVLAGLTDPDVATATANYFSHEMDLWLGDAADARLVPGGVEVTAGGKTVIVERVLAATGRRPNLAQLDLAAAGIAVDARGMPLFDPATMQTSSPAAFIAGDANGELALMHEAADEGAIAGYNAARNVVARFRRRTPLAIVFSRPDIATTGLRYHQLDLAKTVIGTARADEDSRSRVLHGEGGLLRIYADSQSGRLLGACVFAIEGEHLAHQLAWAIQRGETAQSLQQMPFYHPTVEEMLHSALQSVVRQLPVSSELPAGLLLEPENF